jgi:uncharacterized protein with HEPN domain
LRDPRQYLEDIVERCTRIIEYTSGLTRDQVFTDSMRFDGVLHNFHVIGEAVKALPEAVRSQYPDIPWKDIAGMRDFIAHAYFMLDLDILWQGIEKDVPQLRARVREILARSGSDEGSHT